MDKFYQWWGSSKNKKIRPVAMDMWGSPHLYCEAGAGAAGAILFEKFHVLRRLGAALDTVRETESAPSDRQAPTFPQGPGVHATLVSEEPDDRWMLELEAVALGH